MTIRGKAFIAGAYEHPRREIPDRTVPEIHADVAVGALTDAGLSLPDVDAHFCDAEAPGLGPLSMADYLGLRCGYVDTTDTGGSSYLVHLGHAAAVIAAGKWRVALISRASKPRTGGSRPGAGRHFLEAPEGAFETVSGATVPGHYALAARRHMFEFGTTSAHLAEIKVAASIDAQHNPNAFYKKPVTVEEVLESPMISDPLHRLDCCVITDGGGALVVVCPEVAWALQQSCVKVLGHGEAIKHTDNGRLDLTYTGAVWSGPTAFAEAGVTPGDIDYVSIYDSFTITALEAIEDLGFCKKGQGGAL
jgi:acetyl-CoA C-acetyltransferase